MTIRILLFNTCWINRLWSARLSPITVDTLEFRFNFCMFGLALKPGEYSPLPTDYHNYRFSKVMNIAIVQKLIVLGSWTRSWCSEGRIFGTSSTDLLKIWWPFVAIWDEIRVFCILRWTKENILLQVARRKLIFIELDIISLIVIYCNNDDLYLWDQVASIFFCLSYQS